MYALPATLLKSFSSRPTPASGCWKLTQTASGYCCAICPAASSVFKNAPEAVTVLSPETVTAALPAKRVPSVPTAVKGMGAAGTGQIGQCIEINLGEACLIIAGVRIGQRLPAFC